MAGVTMNRASVTALCSAGLNCVIPKHVDARFYDGPGTCTRPSTIDGPCDQDGSCWSGLRCIEGSCKVNVVAGRNDPASTLCTKKKHDE